MLITPWRGRRQREEDVIMTTIKQTNTHTYDYLVNKLRIYHSN